MEMVDLGKQVELAKKSGLKPFQIREYADSYEDLKKLRKMVQK